MGVEKILAVIPSYNVYIYNFGSLIASRYAVQAKNPVSNEILQLRLS